MNIQKTLQHFGLEARETELLLTLMKLGPASIRDIANAAGINRGTSYELLKGLQKKGLVSYHPKGKRRFFCAEPPEQLLLLAKEKQKSLTAALDSLEHEVIPDLRLISSNTDSTRVHYYEGDDGIEHVLKDILNTVGLSDQNSYCVYSSRLIRKHLYRSFPTYTRQRVQRGIHVKVIAIGEGGEEAPLAERKWINTKDSQGGASYVAIYPPKCVMISLTSQEYPTAVVIESESVALALKITFDTLWQFL